MESSRRHLLKSGLRTGATLLAGSSLAAAQPAPAADTALPAGLLEATGFPLVDAIRGRRSRRFALGAEIPGGPLAYRSKRPAQPLNELEQLLLISTVAGNTGWANLIPYNPAYEPRIPNYAGTATGRTFPSAAGFGTTEFFFTDDDGTYYFPTRELAPPVEADLETWLNIHRKRIRRLTPGRLCTPAAAEHMELHNTWCANVPGSTLIIPVVDLAAHHILNLCYLVQNGVCIYDDIRDREVPGLSAFSGIVDVDNPYPMSLVDQMSLSEATVEIGTSCYAGMLMEQALGLGGWMYGGINPLTILGASGDPNLPGLGFRYDVDDRWPLPNVTGLPGVLEGHCPPHFPDMRAAVVDVVAAKFGPDGPFHRSTPGPYRDNERARSSAAAHDAKFVDCVATMAEYVHATYGKFPATVPSIFAMMYLQAHRLDTAFYDAHFQPGAYLETHARHDELWPARSGRGGRAETA